MTATTKAISTVYFTTETARDFSVSVIEGTTAGMTAYIVEVLDLDATDAECQTFCETFRDLDEARAYAQDYIDRNAAAHTIDETGKSMSYMTPSGELYLIEVAYGNLSGEKLGYYAFNKNGDTVHPPVGEWEPVEPFATLDDAKAYLDSIHKED